MLERESNPSDCDPAPRPGMNRVRSPEHSSTASGGVGARGASIEGNFPVEVSLAEERAEVADGDFAAGWDSGESAESEGVRAAVVAALARPGAGGASGLDQPPTHPSAHTNNPACVERQGRSGCSTPARGVGPPRSGFWGARDRIGQNRSGALKILIIDNVF